MSKAPMIMTKFLPEFGDNKEFMEKITNLSEIFGGKLEVFVALPNFSAHHALFPPSGFAVQAKANETPVYSDLFDKKMFRRTVAFQLPEGARILGLKEPVTEETIIRNSERLKQLVNSAFSEEQPIKFKVGLQLIDKKSGKETREWKEEMGYNGSFVGLFVNNERGDYFYDNKLYLALQTHSPAVNDEIHKLMDEASPTAEVGPTSRPKNTFETFFDLSKNKNLNMLARMARRNSHRQLAKFAKLIQLQDAKGNEIEFEEDHLAHIDSTTNEAPWLLHPTIDMSSNIVEKYNNHMVFRNGSIDPTSHKNGILFCEAPFLGLSILKGPSAQNLPYGGSWEASPESLGSFPIYGGRQLSGPELKKLVASESKKYAVEKSRFVWTNCDKNTTHPRLTAYAYRTRNDNWKKVESQLGYNHSNGEVHLKPLVVKIAVDNSK